MRGWFYRVREGGCAGAGIAAAARFALGFCKVGAEDLGAAAAGFGVVHHLGQTLFVADGAIRVRAQQRLKGFGGNVRRGDAPIAAWCAANQAGLRKQVEDDLGAAPAYVGDGSERGGRVGRLCRRFLNGIASCE